MRPFLQRRSRKMWTLRISFLSTGNKGNKLAYKYYRVVEFHVSLVLFLLTLILYCMSFMFISVHSLSRIVAHCIIVHVANIAAECLNFLIKN